MSLIQKIQEDLKVALKKRNNFKVSCLRLLLSEIHNKEIELRGKLKEEDIFSVISKEIKKRKEAVSEFRKGKREDLAEKEENEIKILQSYLPAQLSPSKIRKVTKEVIKEVKAGGPSDFGKVMKAVMGKVKGKVQGEEVLKIVKELLASK